MKVTAESYGHAVILNVDGELTEESLSMFQPAVEHQLANKEVIDLVLNMEQSPFIDSVLLEYLLNVQDWLAERLGQVKLVKCDENVRKIFEVTRLDTVFEIYDETLQAVRAMHP